MTNEKPNYYSIIPAEVRYDNDLKPSAKLLYGEITALANKKGYCFANNKYFADLYDVTPSTVSRWVSSLKNKGYVRVEIAEDKGNKRKIYLNNSRGLNKNAQRGFTKNNKTPIDKNRKHNNTSTNNTSNNITSGSNRNSATPPSLTEKDKKILAVFKQVKLYPFDYENDIEHIRELQTDYPDIDLLEEAKKWRTYKRDKPLKKNSNARLQFRNWVKKASEWQKEDSSKGREVADF